MKKKIIFRWASNTLVWADKPSIKEQCMAPTRGRGKHFQTKMVLNLKCSYKYVYNMFCIRIAFRIKALLLFLSYKSIFHMTKNTSYIKHFIMCRLSNAKSIECVKSFSQLRNYEIINCVIYKNSLTKKNSLHHMQQL